MEQLREITSLLQQVFGLTEETQARLLLSLAVILVIEAIRRIVLRFALRRKHSPEYTYRWTRVSRYVALALVFLIVGRIWFQGFQAIITYLGILSAGLAIALQDVLKNFAAWLFIIWRRPFRLGDRVQVGNEIGDVIDLRIFQFTLLEIGNWVHAEQSTGRLIHVPNGRIFSESLHNFYQAFQYIWSEVAVLVTFESNWRKGKKLLQEIGERHSTHITEAAERDIRNAAQKYMIYYNHLTPIVYTSVEDSGVLLTLRYLCEARKRRGTDQAMWEDILDGFAASEDLDFAYPTTRFYSNTSEGKPGHRPQEERHP